MVELLLSAPVEAGIHPQELPGLDAVARSGTPKELEALVSQSIAASRKPRTHAEESSQDPTTYLQELIAAQIDAHPTSAPKPLAVIVSGKVDPDQAFGILERELGQTTPAKLAAEARSPAPNSLRLVRERIAKPRSQGALGYVIEGPPNGAREAVAWRLLLYILTHDYSGRLGRSAITEKGIVYYISSDYRTDGRRTWATISTGVDPAKADAMEFELRTQIANLAAEPPSAAELDEARNHFLGRDISAAQSNDELTEKLLHEFIETGGLRSHKRLRAELASVTPADLAAASREFGKGTIIRVDVTSER
jgi:predicted Zn-dependent peptidase